MLSDGKGEPHKEAEGGVKKTPQAYSVLSVFTGFDSAALIA
jgi:hypothetical protein